jgi:hypothetical protein
MSRPAQVEARLAYSGDDSGSCHIEIRSVYGPAPDTLQLEIHGRVRLG